MAQMKVYRDGSWVTIPLEATIIPTATATTVGGVRIVEEGSLLKINETGLLTVNKEELLQFIKDNIGDIAAAPAETGTTVVKLKNE